MVTTKNPPATRLPAYRPAPGQRGRDRLRGLAALLALLVLVVGVPLALLAYAGSPLPDSAPSRDWLTAPLDADAVLRIIAAVVWLAWAHFVVCVAVEVVAEVRHRGMSGRVPLGGASQTLARRLVAAVLLLAGTTVVALPAAQAAVSAPRTPTVSTATAHPATSPGPAAGAAGPSATSPTPVVRADAVQKLYEVQPPKGRHYDCLWDIAERYLGDGRRYKELYALNHGRTQPDGRSLRNPDLIHPGWVLRMPADASGPGLRVVAPHAPAGPAQPGTAAPTEAGRSAHAAHGERTGHDLAGGLAGAGSLVAAGLVAALRRRRGYGAAAGDPEPELDLRLAADAAGAHAVDRVLRALATGARAAGVPAPTVLSLALTPTEVRVHFAPAPAFAAAPPWVVSDEGRTWAVARADVERLSADRDMSAPYPGLATFGTMGDSIVLLDVETAGVVSIGGAVEVARDLAVSVAVDLATNAWSDDVSVTMVGFGDDLTEIDPERIRSAASLGDALTDVEVRTARQREFCRAGGLAGVVAGRLSRRDRALWRPEFLVLSAPPGPEESERVALLAADPVRAVGVVVVGDVTSARWRLVADAEGTLDTGVLGIALQAARLRVQHYRQVVDLFRSAGGPGPTGPGPVAGADQPGGPGDEPLALVPEVAAELLDLTRAAPVEVRVLGDLRVDAPGPLDPDLAALVTELVTLVATHADGVHPNVLTSALWPRGAEPEVAGATIRAAAAWLGHDAEGRPRLRQAADGRWRLGPDVRLDWAVLRALLVRSRRPGADEIGDLCAALSLVRGPAWTSLPAGRYAWLVRTGLERDTARAVVHAAARVARLAREHGDDGLAEEALRTGLTMVPTAEVLWRDLLRLVAAVDRDRVAEVAHELDETLAEQRVPRGPEGETDALVDQLLPGRRRIA